jgi:hypothetical protein
MGGGLALEPLPKRPLANHGYRRIGNGGANRRNRGDQIPLAFFLGEMRQMQNQFGFRSQAEQPAQTVALAARGRFAADRDAVTHHINAPRIDSGVDETLPNRQGNSDDAVGAVELEPSEGRRAGKYYSARNHDARPEPAWQQANGRYGDTVSVSGVRMEQIEPLAANQPRQPKNGQRIGVAARGQRMDREIVAAGALDERRIGRRSKSGVDAPALKTAEKQMDLLLSATPEAFSIEMQNSHRRGRIFLTKATAGGELGQMRGRQAHVVGAGPQVASGRSGLRQPP